MTYDEAIAKLRQLDRVRNGEVECDDPDTLVVAVLDSMPEVLAALDPSRNVSSPAVPTEHEDLLTQVARAMWRVAWDACNMSNGRREEDLYQGDPVAMVVQQVLAQAQPAAPMQPAFEMACREFAFGSNNDEPLATAEEIREAARNHVSLLLSQLDYERARRGKEQ